MRWRPIHADLARQPHINRRLVIVGSLGKLGFFAVSLAYALAGEVPAGLAIQAVPDLILGAVFLWWASGAGRLDRERA